MKTKLTRKQRRKLKKQSKAFRELLKVTKHFFKDLFKKLNKVKDKRHQSYITYSTVEILFVALLGHVMTLESCRDMSKEFNKEECIKNVKEILKNEELEELPHYDTINNFLEILPVEELEKIRTYMIKELFKKRSFEQYRYLNKYWMIAIDATGIQSYKERHCEHCLTKVHNKGTAEEKTTYYHNVLEAKLIVGDFVFSIGTEFIENKEENVSKQDCELKAFYRLAEKIKSEYKRLGICIVADSLYACDPVFKTCKKNKWEYIIRFKEGSIKSVAEEFKALIKMDDVGKKEITIKDKIHQEYQWVNEIEYKKLKLNAVYFTEITSEGEQKFMYLSSVKIKDKNVNEICKFGRKRWLIENEGFNVQKNHGYELQHMFSEDYNGMKNHYLLIQMAHIIRQLFDKGVKEIKKYKSSIKQISSLLLDDFRHQLLTEEDIHYINHNQIQVRFTT